MRLLNNLNRKGFRRCNRLFCSPSLQAPQARPCRKQPFRAVSGAPLGGGTRPARLGWEPAQAPQARPCRKQPIRAVSGARLGGGCTAGQAGLGAGLGFQAAGGAGLSSDSPRGGRSADSGPCRNLSPGFTQSCAVFSLAQGSPATCVDSSSPAARPGGSGEPCGAVP